MTKTFISIGGGEIKNKTTAPIDEYIVSLAKKSLSEDVRPYALFFPTASYDSNPYFNSFRKTYTSLFNAKSDVALLLKGCMSVEHIIEKIEKANIIYVGGGNTLNMIDVWRQNGIDKKIWEAYERGAILCGLSAGAICWFDKMYTDSFVEGEYRVHDGLGKLNGFATPHFNNRPEFENVFLQSGETCAYAIEDNCALLFQDGVMKGAISAGGKAYLLENKNGNLTKSEIAELSK